MNTLAKMESVRELDEMQNGSEISSAGVSNRMGNSNGETLAADWSARLISARMIQGMPDQGRPAEMKR